MDTMKALEAIRASKSEDITTIENCTRYTRNSVEVVPCTRVDDYEAGKKLKASIRVMIDHIQSGSNHTTLTREAMLDKLDVSINKLSQIATRLSGRPIGYTDPADEWSERCVIDFRREEADLYSPDRWSKIVEAASVH